LQGWVELIVAKVNFAERTLAKALAQNNCSLFRLARPEDHALLLSGYVLI
jgi:hypothetical protein